jgi:hypothetical protein
MVEWWRRKPSKIAITIQWFGGTFPIKCGQKEILGVPQPHDST